MMNNKAFGDNTNMSIAIIMPLLRFKIYFITVAITII